MTKLTVVFRNFANAPKTHNMRVHYIVCHMTEFYTLKSNSCMNVRQYFPVSHLTTLLFTIHLYCLVHKQDFVLQRGIKTKQMAVNPGTPV